MSTTTKSLILLSFTLIVGFSLGLLADATLVRGRRDRIAELRRPPGMVERFVEVIRPHSGAQADSIRPILEKVAEGNQALIRDANVRLRAHMDSLRTALAPLLDDEQRKRLDDELNRMPPMGIGRGGPGRGRGRPGGPGAPGPDGRGFPPPPDGPPPE